MEKKDKKLKAAYLQPDVMVIKLHTEGVICASGGGSTPDPEGDDPLE